MFSVKMQRKQIYLSQSCRVNEYLEDRNVTFECIPVLFCEKRSGILPKYFSYPKIFYKVPKYVTSTFNLPKYFTIAYIKFSNSPSNIFPI